MRRSHAPSLAGAAPRAPFKPLTSAAAPRGGSSSNSSRRDSDDTAVDDDAGGGGGDDDGDYDDGEESGENRRPRGGDGDGDGDGDDEDGEGAPRKRPRSAPSSKASLMAGPPAPARVTRAAASAPAAVNAASAPGAGGKLATATRRLTHEDIIKRILSKPFRVPIDGYTGKVKFSKPLKDPLRRALHSPDDENALVLYAPDDPADVSEYLQKLCEDMENEIVPKSDEEPVKVHVVVDPVLTKVLRPHQREGVKFMYDCLSGAKIPNGRGCIMADEMGLGKTLQCITLMWTLLKQGPYGRSIADNAIIACPSSLVNNWYSEISKWLGAKLPACPIDGGSREEIKAKLNNFIGLSETSWLKRRAGEAEEPKFAVLIISYETFRLYANILQSKPVGLVLCDEGHRLKNSASQTFQALNQLQTTRRIILSGTPIQNDLTEYFSLLNFVNPGVLGSSNEFHRRFEVPILRARDSLATEDEQKKGQERLNELVGLAQMFTIRRTSTILSKYLPVKVDQVVFCRLTEMQKTMYKNFVKSKSVKKVIAGAGTSTLTAITSLKKIANHPALIFDKCKERAEGFEDAFELFPPGFSPQAYRPELSFRPEMSGKFQVLDTMLAWIRTTTSDKVVLVSNYTQTLDMMELMCRARKYGYVRLDGSLGIAKRMKLVDRFNDKDSRDFAFLLSSKAGGCGLNLIGANRLVLFDPDWNPANDGQAMARVWRDGQKKKVFIYRMVATGTIEEKIFQRQAHKQSLSSVVVDEEEDVERHFTASELKDLFTFKEDTLSDTHDSFNCERCKRGEKLPLDVRISSAEESDMAQWHHISEMNDIDDPILRDSAGDIVSLVFSTQSPDPIKTA